MIKTTDKLSYNFDVLKITPVMYTTKISKIGNFLGVTIPEEILEKLQVGEGDTIFVTETPDGIKLSTKDPEFSKAMSIYQQGSQKYKNALQELA